MCAFCGGSLRQGKTDFIEKNQNNVILIKEVPCEECGQCGEPFFSTGIVKAIESISDSIQCNASSEVSLTVINYNKANVA
jgi:YgiT-type zinc finger domain-containing protein